MANGTCSITGCDRPAKSRGWCGRHYQKWHTHGDPEAGLNRLPFPDNVWDRVEVGHPLGCWLWSGSRDTHGYGRVNTPIGGVAHRVVYTLLVGPIPEGLTIDHLCRNPPCVNPDHVEPVEHAENIARGYGVSVINAAKTHCVNGHRLTDDNVYVREGRWRECKTCRRAVDRKRDAIRKARP